MKAKIFNNRIEAEEWNRQVAIEKGCEGTTEFWYSMVELEEKTTLPKAEYAEKFDIQTVVVEEEKGKATIETVSPEYQELPKTVSVPKCAVLVGNDLDGIDEEVVDISNLIITSDE